VLVVIVIEDNYNGNFNIYIETNYFIHNIIKYIIIY